MIILYHCLKLNFILLFFVYKSTIQQKLKDCFPIRGDVHSLTCRSIPSCSGRDAVNTLSILSQYTRVIFDLENKYSIGPVGTFFNCSFGWSSQITLDFKNIRLVNKYAFDQIKVAKNVRLNIRFDGSGLNLAKVQSSGANAGINTQKLLIRSDAFRNAELSKNAQLSVEITNYKSVYLQDILVDSTLQDETSELSLSVRNCDQLVIKNKKEKFSQDWLLNEFDLTQEEILSEVNFRVHYFKASYLVPDTTNVFFIIFLDCSTWY
jgi:hypothetical protein